MIIPHLRSQPRDAYSLTQQVTIRSLTGNEKLIMIDPSMLVLELKDIIRDEFQVRPSADEICVIFQYPWPLNRARELLNGQQAT